MNHRLHVDIETYSDVDIAKAGLYKYVQSPAFDILLIAWVLDDGPVSVIDLAEPDGFTEGGLREFLRWLYDRDTALLAYNAAFEHYCINEWIRRNRDRLRPLTNYPVNTIPVGDWRCVMAHSMYCGYPAGLAAVGDAMGLPQDKKKLSIGSALIKLFCVPHAPDMMNPAPWRMQPKDDPAKWLLFKSYCMQDVETEREIENRLAAWPMPLREEKLWRLTTEGNARGVMMDMDLVNRAIAIGEAEQAGMMAEAREITGLDNPNSAPQLMRWLRGRGIEAENLTKATVADLLAGDLPEDVWRVLELRQRMAKTSTKKYDAIAEAACDDGRVRGLMMYYGASRSGRWAGRIVQPQNLPQNHLDNLDYARQLAKAGDAELLALSYGSIPDALSQLIRTAFIPRPGCRFAIADYSAIEARVVAWLAGESWVLDAFRAGQDIYCATASQMFGVPVEKHGLNAHLRQRGKVAVLACIAEGSPVLTDRGLVPIEDVQPSDMLWDGELWVGHDGVIYKGERKVITYDGLTATPDHLVWVEGKPEPIYFRIASTIGAHLLRTGAGGQAIRLGEDHQPRKARERGEDALPRAHRVPELRIDTVDAVGQPARRQDQGLPAVLTAEANTAVAEPSANGSQAALREPERPEFPSLRRTGHPLRLPKHNRGGSVSDRDLRVAGQEDGDRPHRQQRELCAGEYSVCDQGSERGEQGDYRAEQVRPEVLALCGDNDTSKAGAGIDPSGDHTGRGAGGIRAPEELEGHQRTVKVYDIRNAGRHHRFTVSGRLVHNCGYGGGASAMRAMGGDLLGMDDTGLKSLVDQWRQANPAICRLWGAVETAAVTCVRTGEGQTVTIEGSALVFRLEADDAAGLRFLTVELPAGRKLFYADPVLKAGKWGGAALSYMSLNQNTKKWGRTDTWGGKLVENITQAVARDCLAETLFRLHMLDLDPVFTVHDEVICEVDDDIQLNDILAVMAAPIDWAPGLPLKGAGFCADYYQKD
ncbi:MAG: hypothetical protein IKD53_04495 [Clostridia bacterium]|nr:hypothetical protein [Clostridia bacterium]